MQFGLCGSILEDSRGDVLAPQGDHCQPSVVVINAVMRWGTSWVRVRNAGAGMDLLLQFQRKSK